MQQIISQASLLFERLEHPGETLEPRPESADLIESRLDAWAHALDSRGERQALQRFLDWQDTSLAAVGRAVDHPIRRETPTPLPAWAETLGEALSNLAAEGVQAIPGLPDAEIPFKDLLVPFVHVFWQRVERQASAECALLTPEARLALERGLLARLSEISAQTFYREFHTWRASRLAQLTGDLDAIPDEPGRELYREFVRQMLAGNLATFFHTYPVLARLLSTRTLLWGEAHIEFLQRLSIDLPKIGRVFEEQPHTLKVKALEVGLSDPHRGGRGVIGLTLASGLRLVYKPKNLGAAAAYNQLLAWLNRQSALSPESHMLDLRPLKVLNQGDHGWVEYAAHQPCTGQAQVVRYYRRAGMSLCLIYALDGTDCHAENLIACGEYPLLVDNETLLRPRARIEPPDKVRAGASFQAGNALAHSVLHTGLLPVWKIGGDRHLTHNNSGLGEYPEPVIPPRAPAWMYANTDLMTLTSKALKMTQDNLPRLKVQGRVSPVPITFEIVDAVVQGFQAMYRFLAANRRALLSPGGPLQAFRGQQVRFLFRRTQVYTLIQKQLRQPKYLRDGADYGIYLERLARVHLLAPHKPTGWPMLAAERRAMHQLDIPVFSARVDGDALILESGEEIAGYFSGSSFEQVIQRLETMGKADLARQTELVRISLYTDRIRDEETEKQAVHDVAATSIEHQVKQVDPVDPARDRDRETFVAQAIALAQELEARATWGEDGSATWIAPHYLPPVGRFQVTSLGPHLYSGLAGIALFLGALEKVMASCPATLAVAGQTPTRSAIDARNLCIAALESVREGLQSAEFNQTIEGWGLGGTSGLGSLLYALVRVGQFLDEPVLQQEAQSAAQLLTAEQIAADKTLDVVGGAAGAILGLLTVYEATHDSATLERAVDCGQHLLANAEGQSLTGFAHGAAGIAYALLRLYAATGEVNFRAAAQEAIAYEASVFVESEGNWPDLRPSADGLPPNPDEPHFGVAWCTGATGIGLARLGGLPALDTPAIRRDIEFALEATQRVMPGQRHQADHLCCGNLGRVELLLVAGKRLGRAELTTAARREAWQVIERAERLGAYHLATNLPRGLYCPGFFKGAAGVGYQLLHLAYPTRLPSALLWE